ncbi:MAG: metal ABC transporter ATP-binding protein [Pararhizobium sp.]
MSALTLDSVTLVQGQRTVLDDVSLAIPDTGFIGVLGPNGAGKTTLMRAALGLLAPAAGRLSVLGEPPGRGNPAVGYMPQSRSVPRHMRLSGREFLLSALGGGHWGRPFATRSDRRIVDEALEQVEGGALADRPIAELSGGERQRLFIAEALMGRPRLLMLDEPLSSLDPGHQRAIVSLVARIAAERKIAVLFSAHEVNPVLPVADLILYLGNGKAALGSVDSVVNAPVLSKLYNAPVHVSRIGGRILLMAEDCELEQHPHDHDHHHARHEAAPMRSGGRP